MKGGGKLKSNLRFGWTTGTCATAALVAAYRGLVSGEFPETVSVVTPSGKTAHLAIVSTGLAHGAATASVIKDAGDDPDVTHGAEIVVGLAIAEIGQGVTFAAGPGVGTVTKAGLPIGVGGPAINPVPRQMMGEAVENLSRELGGPRDVVITVSVPFGEEIAKKTWNPRLGIAGGISILGTTGIVRPFSCSAWIASIHRGIDVARANGLGHVAGSTGARSESLVRGHYGLPDIALLDMGDFAGGMLKYMKRHPVPRLTIAGGFGKLVKLAQGHGDLHSARSRIDFAALADMAGGLSMDKNAVANANTALEVLQIAGGETARRLAALVARDARATAMEILDSEAIAVDVMVADREGKLLAMTHEGDTG